MNVKFQSKGVCRHFDLMTHNHGSMGPNTPPNIYFDSMNPPSDKCKKEREEMDKACGTGGDPKEYEGKTPEQIQDIRDQHRDEWKKKCPVINPVDEKKVGQIDGIKRLFIKFFWPPDHENKDRAGKRANTPRDGDQASDFSKLIDKDPCLSARRCRLTPYEDAKKSKQTKQGVKDPTKLQGGCCPGQTGHHLLPDAMFRKIGGTIIEGLGRDGKELLQGWSKYTEGEGLTICLEGIGRYDGSHGEFHTLSSELIEAYRDESGAEMPFSEASAMMAKLVEEKYPQCSKECIEAQLTKIYEDMWDDKDASPVLAHSGDSKDTGTLKNMLKPDSNPKGSKVS
jgi:hypothetical protein